MSEEYLIRNCAPTLAGIKTGNLFSCPCSNQRSLLQSVRSMNRMLLAKGLRLLSLRFSQHHALLYLYRPSRLWKDLSQDSARKLLHAGGYCIDTCEKCLGDLVKKLRTQLDFPHEIGLFLGYPPEDVEGFILNHAENYKFSGCWKVYGDPEYAKEAFAKYQHCSKTYYALWQSGRSLDRLTVTG